METTLRACPFVWMELRTFDVRAAAEFYADVLELPIRPGELGDSALLGGEALGISRLPERAIANGARAHWLGLVGVDDPRDAADRFARAGAERLGPEQTRADGAPLLALRDPLGAVVGLTRGGRPPPPVAWCQLHTTDPDRAAALYGAMFGWHFSPKTQLEGGTTQRMLAFEAGGDIVGGAANTASSPGVHTHWLYFFRTADVARARARASARGAVFVAEVTLPNGDELAAFDDPAGGAAFGLYQTVTNTRERSS